MGRENKTINNITFHFHTFTKNHIQSPFSTLYITSQVTEGPTKIQYNANLQYLKPRKHTKTMGHLHSTQS